TAATLDVWGNGTTYSVKPAACTLFKKVSYRSGKPCWREYKAPGPDQCSAEAKKVSMAITQPLIPARCIALAIVIVDCPFHTPTSTTTAPASVDAPAMRSSDG